MQFGGNTIRPEPLSQANDIGRKSETLGPLAASAWPSFLPETAEMFCAGFSQARTVVRVTKQRCPTLASVRDAEPRRPIRETWPPVVRGASTETGL